MGVIDRQPETEACSECGHAGQQDARRCCMAVVRENPSRLIRKVYCGCLCAALSSRDTEISEVLERLQNLLTGEPMCWCRVRWQSGEHDGACEQAQSLYAKLQGTP